MDRTTSSTTTPRSTSRNAGDSTAGRATERGGASRAAGQTRPTRTPHSTVARGMAGRALVCSGCGGRGRTRDEVADLAVDWLVHDPTIGAAHTARFHQACRPAGIPGELACAGCGDGPLLDPTLTAVLVGAVDLFTAAALTGWLDDHGWTGDPHLVAGAASELEDLDVGEGPRCPACSPRSTWSRRAPAGVAR